MSDAPQSVINEARDKVRLGELVFEYEESKNLLTIVNASDNDEIIFAAGEKCFPELWEGFVAELEAKIACGPMLSALRQIRTLSEDPSLKLENNRRAYAQLGQKAVGIVEQVLDEFEKTSEARDDTNHVSMLESSSAPRGVAPPEIAAVLNEESEMLGVNVEVFNWQVTRLGDTLIIFVLYRYQGEPVEGFPREGIRHSVYVNDKRAFSAPVEVSTD